MVNLADKRSSRSCVQSSKTHESIMLGACLGRALNMQRVNLQYMRNRMIDIGEIFKILKLRGCSAKFVSFEALTDLMEIPYK